MEACRSRDNLSRLSTMDRRIRRLDFAAHDQNAHDHNAQDENAKE